MSKLEPNMYVRDRKGRVDKIIGFEGALIEFEKELMCGYIDCNNFTKASHNIIDLISVGDYVNGVQVVEVKNNQVFTDDINWNEISDLETDMGRIIGYGYERLPIDNIKSIVTKEQFKSVEYEVK